MNKLQIAVYFIEIFPEYTVDYNEHIMDYGELLGHVFFGDIINPQIVQLLKSEEDLERTQAIFSFINDMYLLGDDECKNIVVVTILEYLGDETAVLKKSFNYLNDELMKESNNIENSLGRK